MIVSIDGLSCANDLSTRNVELEPPCYHESVSTTDVAIENQVDTS